VKTTSVALATYNGERFLADQLASLAEQTVLPHELVVHDDGSTDGTLGILADFERASPFPVRVTRGEGRLGFADASLAAARACTGDLVALCDQDDVFLRHKLERCAAASAEPDVLVVLHSSRVVDERLEPTGRLYPAIPRTEVVPPLASDPWLAVRGMSMVVDARVVRLGASAPRPPSHYLEGEPMHHDEWLYALARALGSVAFLSEPLALYRQHGANVTRIPGRLARIRDSFSTGWAYYARRRDQARGLAGFMAGLGTTGDDERLRGRARAAAVSLGDLAARLERRAAVYEPGDGRVERSRTLARLARSGLYAPSAFGRGALARDALMVALGRHAER
jgi:glycosyltransferase involved in cell wall biosynthesis